MPSSTSVYVLAGAIVFHAFATGVLYGAAVRSLYHNVVRALVDATNEIRKAGK